jgi:hypothetical protein
LVANPGGTTLSISQQLRPLNSDIDMSIFTLLLILGAKEIRGQILPVPEPSTWALIGLRATGLIWRTGRWKN